MVGDYPRFVKEVEGYLPVLDGLPDNLTIVDFGAHQGSSIEIFLEKAKDIYAVEPAEINFKILEEKFGSNPKVHLLNYAMWATTGTMTLLDNASDGGFSLKLGGDHGVKTPTKSFEDFIKDNKIEHIDVLKIDIEGSEYDVCTPQAFKDFSATIGRIVGEVHAGNSKFITLLEELGFTIISLHRGVFLAKRNHE